MLSAVPLCPGQFSFSPGELTYAGISILSGKKCAKFQLPRGRSWGRAKTKSRNLERCLSPC